MDRGTQKIIRMLENRSAIRIVRVALGIATIVALISVDMAQGQGHRPAIWGILGVLGAIVLICGLVFLSRDTYVKLQTWMSRERVRK